MEGAREPVSSERVFSLEIPADPAYVATARLFSAAVGRQFGVEEERVEDLKVAISEACTVVMREGSGSVLVRTEERDRALGFELFGSGTVAATLEEEGTPQDFSKGVAAEMIRALFEGAAIETSERGTRVAFSIEAPG